MSEVSMIRHPGPDDWMGVKQRALVTMGKTRVIHAPDQAWKHAILEARHSPIRYLQFSFMITCPYWVSVHLVRHVHAQPYVRSQRNDIQSDYERNKAPQDQPVRMIWDMNAEELMIIANKRLCNKACPETTEVVRKMCRQVLKECPEFTGLLVPSCQYSGTCHEMHPCNMKPGT